MLVHPARNGIDDTPGGCLALRTIVLLGTGVCVFSGPPVFNLRRVLVGLGSFLLLVFTQASGPDKSFDDVFQYDAHVCRMARTIMVSAKFVRVSRAAGLIRHRADNRKNSTRVIRTPYLKTWLSEYSVGFKLARKWRAGKIPGRTRVYRVFSIYHRHFGDVHQTGRFGCLSTY